MRKKNFSFWLLPITLLIIAITVFSSFKTDTSIISYTANLQKDEVKLYWKNDQDQNFKSLLALKNWLDIKHHKLIFAMNGGMYKSDLSPQGLYIENEKTLAPVDTANGNGNFYLKPNGVFYITGNNKPIICRTEALPTHTTIKYATQSGPMLVIDSKIHSAFKQDSSNLNIRNGVGILPDNTVIFAMSTKEINFYDFAMYFKNRGCKNALYLDGFVSRTYFPEKNWTQTDGNFGVIIGVTKK